MPRRLLHYPQSFLIARLGLTLFACLSLLNSCQSGEGLRGSNMLSSTPQAAGSTPPLKQHLSPSDTGLELPAPADLLPQPGSPRFAAYVPADLEKEANLFAPALPSRNVAAGTGHLDFAPGYANGGPISGLAYATYQFKIEGYDLNSEVRLLWLDPAPAAGTAWLGLANWDNNRWDWFPSDASGRSHPSSLSPYLDFGGDMLLIALLTGATPATLDLVRVGSQVPVADLTTAGPRYAYGSLSVDFDASASTDADGSIVKYEWDLDGDGVYEAQSPDDPLISKIYSTPGTYNAAVKVTDDTGVSDTALLGVSVGGPWERTLGFGGYDLYYDVAVAPDGSVWACGYSQDPQLINFSDLVLTHFAADGTILSNSYWRGFSFDAQFAGALCIGSDGAVYVGGTGHTAAAGHTLFQRYSAEGTLDWSHSAVDFLGEIHDMLVLNGTVYAIGEDNDGSTQRGTIFTFPAHNFDNQPLSIRLSEQTELNAMTYFPGDAVDPPAILVVGSTGVNSDADLLYFSMTPALEISMAQKWGAVGGSQLGRAIALTGGPLNYNVLLGAYRGTNPHLEACVLRPGVDTGYNFQGASHVQIMSMWPAGSDGSAYVLVLESDSLQDLGQIRLTRIDSQLNPIQHSVFASGIPSWGISGIPYAGEAFLISGGATMVGGGFSDGTNTNIGPSATWADLTLTKSSNPMQFDTAFPLTLQPREPSIDTGAGNHDGMVLMNELPHP